MDDDYARAKEALLGLEADVRLGMGTDRAGGAVVRVSIDQNEPNSLVEILHKRLQAVPHEIRRTRIARLEGLGAVRRSGHSL